jgi:hypothetical protein
LHWWQRAQALAAPLQVDGATELGRALARGHTLFEQTLPQ